MCPRPKLGAILACTVWWVCLSRPGAPAVRGRRARAAAVGLPRRACRPPHAAPARCSQLQGVQADKLLTSYTMMMNRHALHGLVQELLVFHSKVRSLYSREEHSPRALLAAGGCLSHERGPLHWHLHLRKAGVPATAGFRSLGFTGYPNPNS